ncbi:hypothetical protein FRC11_007384 [Ceratobasidium sp. 423]|nr:hypothetical protein FRC11_007384 [Ceratobasidium sp. 423]
MSKRPAPASPLPNSKPSKSRLTMSNQQNEPRSASSRPPAQGNAFENFGCVRCANSHAFQLFLAQGNATVLHNKTNAPKAKTGNSTPSMNEKAKNPASANAQSAVKPQAAAASKPSASKPSASKQSASKPSATKPSATKPSATKASKTLPRAAKDKAAAKRVEIDVDAEDDVDDDESGYEEADDGEEDEESIAGSVVDEVVEEPKAKGRKASAPKAGAVKTPGVGAKSKTNRVQRKSVTLTTPAARDIYSGQEALLNRLAKTSQLAILRTREERKTAEVKRELVEAERQSNEALARHEEKLFGLDPSYRKHYIKARKTQAKAKLLEARNARKALKLKEVEKDIELYRLRDKLGEIEKEQKEKEKQGKQAKRQADMDELESLCK